ncbi:hypothetical protein EMIHUDRAFT_444279 [Emiliania huxleyi CCMP1516]|uniref:Choice-of-anchor I domain-containing protein n=2 Tax=Emiliania huxleyi TaxID=2903 RepID=A0A0D3JG28_EMIH1|nr:hypothetical protein EMIHUDRAFT_444279 [Emiliania huxleyi CCMP1516]EOD22463.1 hypothetical protein EMIHUDRAFT_444279 [Emiliania huxleyi CCMP1516]|eukprot:XP_005774892.1 hypothetical protein EMIHUDRAFT_444279 [Emiliania huxleyi CCMP1516]
MLLLQHTLSMSGVITGMDLLSRVYVPFDSTGNKAFGMGAAEKSAYDPMNKIAYAVSEQAVLSVVDYADPKNPQILFGIDLTDTVAAGTGSITDVTVCGGLVAIGATAKVKTEPGVVTIYSSANATTPATMKQKYVVGPLPDMVAWNHDCTKIAVANEGEGVYTDDGLVDPVGSVSIIEGFDVGGMDGEVKTVDFAAVAETDEALKAKGVHLPLELKAQEFYDVHSAHFSGLLNFTASRAAYSPATQLEPEYLTWSSDGTKVYANCQENSAIVTIDVETHTATRLDALPLKDWSEDGTTEGIDTVKDGKCVLEHKPGFKSMRHPDAIATLTVDGIDYIVTANEGDDKEYGDYESKQKFKDVIDTNETFTNEFQEFSFFAPDVGSDAYANFGDTKMSITIGSSGVDYSDPTKPVFKGAVGFGGRGLSIWKASDMSLVWDSGSMLEKNQCLHYPWSHNSVHDEEFAMIRDSDGNVGTLFDAEKSGQVSTTAPYLAIQDGWTSLQETIWEINDKEEDGCDVADEDVAEGRGCDATYCACPLGKTVDERSLKDGAGPEAVVVGEACGCHIMVTATEKQGTAFVFDVSIPASPDLLFVQHLSPASETKNPSVAYDDGTLGEVDPESMTFLAAADSPTGYAGVMFAGAWSGTLSLYEFKKADGSKCSTCPAGCTPGPNYPATQDRRELLFASTVTCPAGCVAA